MYLTFALLCVFLCVFYMYAGIGVKINDDDDNASQLHASCRLMRPVPCHISSGCDAVVLIERRLTTRFPYSTQDDTIYYCYLKRSSHQCTTGRSYGNGKAVKSHHNSLLGTWPNKDWKLTPQYWSIKIENSGFKNTDRLDTTC